MAQQQRYYQLFYKDKPISNRLSEGGKFEALQIITNNFDMGMKGAYDPEDIEVKEID